MTIKAILQSGDEIQVNGPLMLMADDGHIAVSPELFSCAQNGQFIKIHIDKLRRANFSEDSLGKIKELMSSELPSIKEVWKKLHNHHIQN
ncbi:hypothetical protein WH96_00240 [Kiloniella spongiae]|uniref:Uncharacterized protein n=1 Tax=Kiloniella spongiae TaxID=1489064 RepID=A0A0H2MIM7_9PROT|nr:hypothetical protein [Kiloniella spongiae]KLN62016.1 hypothetical protein WH96_00240 [Kiloniella spongiae]